MLKPLHRLGIVLLVLTGLTMSGTAAEPSHPLSQIAPIDENLDMTGPGGAYNITGVPAINPADSDLRIGGGMDVNGQLQISGGLSTTGGISVGADINMNGNAIDNFFNNNCGTSEAIAQVYPNGSFVCTNVSDVTSGKYVDEAGDTMTGTLNMGGSPITGLPTPSGSGEAVNKGYVDTTFLPLSGGAMTGTLSMNGHPITNPTTVDGIDLDGTGNALTIDANNHYAVASNSIGDTEIANGQSFTMGGLTLNGALAMGSNPITTTSTVNGVDLDGTGNAIIIDGSNHYAVASGSIASSEINDGSIASIDIGDGNVQPADLAETYYTTGEVDANFLSLSGGTMNGPIDMNGYNINNVGQLNTDGSAPYDAMHIVNTGSETTSSAMTIRYDDAPLRFWGYSSADGSGSATLELNHGNHVVEIPNGNLDMGTNSITNVNLVDGVNLQSTGNALTIDGSNQYAVAANSINANELTSGYETGSAYDGRFLNDGTGTVTSTNIADSTIASADIGDGNVQPADLAETYYTTGEVDSNFVNINGDSMTGSLTISASSGPPNNPMLMVSNPANEGAASGIVVETDGDGLSSGDVLLDLRANSDGVATNRSDTQFIVGAGGSVAIDKNYDDGDTIPYTLEVGGTVGIQDQLYMNGYAINNVGAPNSGDDAMSRNYADNRYINDGTGTITSTNIADSTIAAADIGSGAVGSSELTSGYSTGSAYDSRFINDGTGTVTTTNLLDGDVQPADLAETYYTTGEVDANFLSLSGGTMNGAIDMNNYPIRNAQFIESQGDLRWNNGQSSLISDQGGAMELGGQNGLANTGGNQPYIDFHYGSGSAVDYHARLQVTGSNTLALNGASLDMGTNSITNVNLVDGVNLQTTGNALTIDGSNQYAVAANSINANELTSGYETGSAYDGRFLNDGTGTVSSTNIADSTIASADIGDGNVQPADLAETYYTTGEVDANFLSLSGGTMSGSIDMYRNTISNIGAYNIDSAGATWRWITADSANVLELGIYNKNTGTTTWDVIDIHRTGTIGISTDARAGDSALNVGGDISLSGSLRDGDGTVNVANDIDVNSGGTSGGVHINGADALTGTPANGWLRLNQGEAFSNGVYTPGFMRVDGGMQLRGDLNMRNNQIKNAVLAGSVQLPTGNDAY